MSLKKVFLKRTLGEWEAIDKKVSELEKSDLSSYLRSEIPKVQIRLNDCPECITPAEGKKKQRAIYITENSYNTIKGIADKMDKPVASVIDELFIAKLIYTD